MSLNKKSLISFLLVFVFIFSVVPFNLAFADEPESEPVTSVATDNEDGMDAEAAPTDDAATTDADTADTTADAADDTTADTDADAADNVTADAADDTAATDADTSDDGDAATDADTSDGGDTEAETTNDDTTAADTSADDTANVDDNTSGDDTADDTANADDNTAGDDTADDTTNADDNTSGDDIADDTTNADDNTTGDDNNTENAPVTDKVLVSSEALLVDGKPIEDATIFNINGSNYFKLRDIASIVNKTASQFEVAYEHNVGVNLTTGNAYTSNEQERLGPPAGVEPGVEYPITADNYGDADSITVNGQTLENAIDGKKIDNNNYYKLRDLGEALGFSVGYFDGTMYISTSLYGYLKNCAVVNKALGEVVDNNPPVFYPEKYSYHLTTEGDTICLNTRIDFDDGLHFDAYIEFTEATVAGTDGKHVYTAHGSLSKPEENGERYFIQDYSTDFAVQDTPYATINMWVNQKDFMDKTHLSESSFQSYLNLLNAAVRNSLTQFDIYVMHAKDADFNPAELYTMSALGFISAG